MKSGRDKAAGGSIPGSSPRPDREHRKPQPTTCYTVVCVKTAVEISEESRKRMAQFVEHSFRGIPSPAKPILKKRRTHLPGQVCGPHDLRSDPPLTSGSHFKIYP